jgi:hypothetical protein
MGSFRPKNKIAFPNRWAVDSFLLRVKRASGWEYVGASNETNIKIRPKGAEDYILIGLLKSGRGYEVEINAEKSGNASDQLWHTIFEYAKRYRC